MFKLHELSSSLLNKDRKGYIKIFWALSRRRWSLHGCVADAGIGSGYVFMLSAA